VQEGEEIVITRHGRPVARLVPDTEGVDRSQARAAVERIRARAKSLKAGAFDWDALKADRDAGRPRCGTAVSLILDSSATLAWVYSDETTGAIREVFTRLSEKGAWVPGLWRLEVANILEIGVQRRRHDAAFRDATLADLALLPISLDLETDRQGLERYCAPGGPSQLTVYDAAYLELAQRRGLPLATLDSELRAAANAEGVVLLGKPA
jgi:predicted nucleic acid-binding protein/antitoxin (DNA-binding transcriptional repressor) of toxin-antitoxin stability system